ncbi:MAG: glycoside hydrolase family 10 protein, partial [Tuberibacillus sp.]
IENNALGYADILKRDVYNYQALTPAAPWNGDAAPQKPNTVKAEKTDAGVELTIDDKIHTDARRYVIYRFDGNNDGDYNDPRHIIGVVYNKSGLTTFTDTTAEDGHWYTYGVTSISATGVESKDVKKTKIMK